MKTTIEHVLGGVNLEPRYAKYSRPDTPLNIYYLAVAECDKELIFLVNGPSCCDEHIPRRMRPIDARIDYEKFVKTHYTFPRVGGGILHLSDEFAPPLSLDCSILVTHKSKGPECDPLYGPIPKEAARELGKLVIPEFKSIGINITEVIVSQELPDCSSKDWLQAQLKRHKEDEEERIAYEQWRKAYEGSKNFWDNKS